MFEQSIYQQEPASEPVVPTQDVDLFHNYELKGWDLAPRLYKIVAMSAVANLLAVLIFAQTSILTAKGCDSPLVGSVCQVLDTVYIGALLFGTKREYVDADYTKTNLKDADITYIELPPESEKLYYPDGYFELANPEQTIAQDTTDEPFPTDIPMYPGIPSIRPNSPNSLLNTPPVYAKRKKDVVDGELPTGFDNDPTTGTTKPPANGKNANSGNGIPGIPGSGNTNTTAQIDPNKVVNPTNPVAGVEINKRPLADLANNVNDLLDKKQVNLESAFVVNASGKLTKDGKIDPKTFKWGAVASQDQKIVDVVKAAIEAINDGGYLQYLKDMSGKDFNMMLQQDDLNISAVVQSEMESDRRAKSISSALKLLMDVARNQKSSVTANQNDKDDLILLQGASIEADGKKVVIKFLVPKNVAMPMIQRKLAEQKNAPKQPNGNAVVRPNTNASE